MAQARPSAPLPLFLPSLSHTIKSACPNQGEASVLSFPFHFHADFMGVRETLQHITCRSYAAEQIGLEQALPEAAKSAGGKCVSFQGRHLNMQRTDDKSQPLAAESVLPMPHAFGSCWRTASHVKASDNGTSAFIANAGCR